MQRRRRHYGSHAERIEVLAVARRERGRVLLVAGPAAATLGLGALPDGRPPHETYALLGGALLAMLAGVFLERRPALGRAVSLLACIVGLLGLHHVLIREPAIAIGAGVVVAAVYLYLFVDPNAAPESWRWMPGRDLTARIGLTIAGASSLWVVVVARPWPTLVGAAFASVAALSLAIRWAVHGHGALSSRIAVGLVLAGGFVGALLNHGDPTLAASVLGGAQLVSAALVYRPEGEGPDTASSPLFTHPARVLVATFAALSVIGTILLALPASAEDGASVGVLDATFTAVSAVCVTGLIVLDTPNAFGTFGEASLLVLIQIGGLGIMTFYTVALAALGRRLSLRHERALAGAMQIEERNELTRSMWRILGVTFVSELVGAAALTASFMRHGEGLAEAAWRGLFTAVSAFCNAGFALQSDSLIPYQRDPAILHVVALLIIVGGLSPVAVMAIPQFLRRRSVDVQVSLILWTSALLLAVGAVLYGLMEWTVSLGHLSFADRLHNTWFQSVTLRTAGFNSVDLAVSRPATQTMMILQMFVGGSPGGTAGGVKTTTAAVLLITVAATLRGHPDATAFRRIISRRTVFKAAAVVTVGALMAFGALTAILLTQLMPPEVALFEVISALATVGLSTGGTGALDSVGKIIIIACMFAGRVGPLTLFVLLAQQQGMHHQPRYPDVEVDVG